MFTCFPGFRGDIRRPGLAFLFLLAPICLPLLSCQNRKQEQASPKPVVDGDRILLTKDAELTRRLRIDTARLVPYRDQLLTAGTVRVVSTGLAEIASPFSGRVTRSFLRLGMRTSVDTPLFEITSPDFIEAQKVYFQEKSQVELARKNLLRQQDLVTHGVGTGKDLEEAQTNYEVRQKELENAAIGIRLFKADPARLQLGQPLVVRSPIAGEVIENKVVLGQFLRNDAESVATVANLSPVWIVGQVKEKDMRFLRQMDACSIEVAAFPEKQIQGKIHHIKDAIDEATRSVEVLISAPNPDKTLRPGMYVTVRFLDRPSNALLVPSKAILQSADASFVFVEEAPGRYVRRKVRPGDTANGRTVVLSGLSAGEKFISEGGYYLLDAR